MTVLSNATVHSPKLMEFELIKKITHFQLFVEEGFNAASVKRAQVKKLGKLGETVKHFGLKL